jgi:hypothetical protein
MSAHFPTELVFGQWLLTLIQLSIVTDIVIASCRMPQVLISKFLGKDFDMSIVII